MGNLSASQAPGLRPSRGEFVFVRHGFSCANALKRAGGIVNKAVRRGQWAPDSALTEEGKAQARDGAAEIVRWGERRKASFVALDGKLVILTSPLRRAMQTGFELGATLAPRLGFDDFAIVPVTGLVEWPKSRMSDVGARSDDNIPYFRWGDDAEIAAKVPVRFQTAFRIAEDENRNPVLADAFEGRVELARIHFREGWRKRSEEDRREPQERPQGRRGDRRLAPRPNGAVQRGREAGQGRGEAVRHGSRPAGVPRRRPVRGRGRRVPPGEDRESRNGVPPGARGGDPPRSGRAEGRRQGRRAPDDIDLKRLEAECGSKVAEALARRKEKIRQKEAWTGEKDVEARRRFNDLLQRETEKRR